MNIRRRIFLSYILLIFFFLLFMAFYLYLDMTRIEIDTYVKGIYKSKNTWNEILISMNEIVINWSDGRAYEIFKTNTRHFDDEIYEISEKIKNSGFYIFPLKSRFASLYEIWTMAKTSISRLTLYIESTEFDSVISELTKAPGLQRLNHVWTELFYNGSEEDIRRGYVIKQVIDEVEFFPIYSETINRLYNVILNETESQHLKILNIQKVIMIIFFIVFLICFIVISLIFTNSISGPIINSILELTEFMGNTIEKVEYEHKDELKLLRQQVKRLIEHYTELSRQSRKLAEGDINNVFDVVSDNDIVGNAMKEVSLYLNELAEVSSWIKQGKYGTKIKTKSDKDILAQSFNIMSLEIHEKISTLKNMFETVEEGIIVIDEDKKIIEFNGKLLELADADKKEKLKNGNDFFSLFRKDSSKLIKCLSGSISLENYYTEMTSVTGRTFPVRITARIMEPGRNNKKRIMLFITNESWKLRAKRQKEKLKAQAATAEIKALRAQINPHFFFNTLNSIAHLAENNSEEAVNTIEKLADLFRYNLAATKRETVSILEEINYIKQFLEIEKLRYEKRLSVDYKIDDEVLKQQIPPMLFQPVVENAVHHGSDSKGNINIEIIIKMEKNCIRICIKDRGNRRNGIESFFSGNGTGIKNVNSRLKTLYNSELRIEENYPQGYAVSMKIAMERL